MAEITRKEFLKGVGKTVAGVTVVGTLGSLLSGCATAEPTAVVPEKPLWPFPYKKLDSEVVMLRAFNAYKSMGG